MDRFNVAFNVNFRRVFPNHAVVFVAYFYLAAQIFSLKKYVDDPRVFVRPDFVAAQQNRLWIDSDRDVAQFFFHLAAQDVEKRSYKLIILDPTARQIEVSGIQAARGSKRQQQAAVCVA